MTQMVGWFLGCLLSVISVLPAWSACSDATNIGKATINEYYFGTDTNFIEVMILNNVLVPESVWSTWQVQVYDAAGAAVLSYGLSNPNVQSCPTASKTYLTYPVAAGLPSPAGGGINVVLLDGSGNEIDYLKFAQSSPIPQYYVPTCASFAYDIDLVVANLGNKDVARIPDGKGSWAISGGTGSGTTYTPCTSNNASILKAVSVGTVPLGSTALFSITVRNPNKQSINSVTVNDLLPSGLGYVSHTATVGNYVAGSGIWTIGTIASGGSATLTLNFSGDLLGTYTNTAILYSGAVEISRDFAGITVVPANIVDHFTIIHDGYGINCLTEPVRVTAVNATGTAVTGYGGTIILNTQSGKGTWSLATGSGSFSDPTPNDGLASYTFSPGLAPADAGTVLFNLNYPEGTTPINIRVTEGAISDDNSEGLLYFTPSAFTVTSLPLGNPPPGMIPAFSNQTAGTPFTAYLSAYGQTPTDPVCGVIEAYTGVKNLRFWTHYSNPAYGGLTALIQPTITAAGTINADKFENQTATVLPVTFTSGQAQVTVKYKDVGLIGLNLKDTSTPADPVSLPSGIRGGSNLFVVKPAGFTLTNIIRTIDSFANPAAIDQNGGVFIMAGNPFTATVTALDSEGDATPSYGQETPAESVNPVSTLIAPAGGNNPAVTVSTGFSFSNGVATATDLSWSEVGIMRLTPAVADGNYLGAGAVTGSITGNIGRFTPHNFNVIANTPQFDTACGSFTYLGQPFRYSTLPASSPILTVTARNTAGTTTQNYSGVWWKMTNVSLTGKSYTAAIGTLDTGLLPAIDPVITSGGSGSGTLTFGSGGGIAFNRAGPVPNFDAEIRLQINVIDSDGVAYASNPAAFGVASSGNGIAFSGSKNIRWGRLTLQNAYGSELLPLSLPLRAEYYNSSNFVTNSDDNCTLYDGATATLANYRFNLQAGETSASGVGTLLAGTENPANPLLLSAPGVGNDGSVDLTLPVNPWLYYDWDGNSVHDNDPSARGSFGIYKGNPRLIYLRELIR